MGALLPRAGGARQARTGASRRLAATALGRASARARAEAGPGSSGRQREVRRRSARGAARLGGWRAAAAQRGFRRRLAQRRGRRAGGQVRGRRLLAPQAAWRGSGGVAQARGSWWLTGAEPMSADAGSGRGVASARAGCAGETLVLCHAGELALSEHGSWSGMV
jgi:hypothetical protein